LLIASAALIGLNFAKDADAKLVLFNPHQNKTVIALTELIIPRTDTPCTNDASVHRNMDLFLSVASAADQKKFLAARALDHYSKKRYQRDFVNLTESEQVALLTPNPTHPFFEQFNTLTCQMIQRAQ
jgi:hypothetical protein